MIYEITKSSYPETLQNAKGVPKRLFIRGKLPDVKHKFLCVIGSRMLSPYGQDVVRKLILGLRGYPISIVSGLAIGIDSLSHRAALEAGLHCCAFPGSGLNWDVIYPQARLSLAREIVESGGALLSQWIPEQESTPWTFPARNVLMAGISHATLIIEAGRHSGSLMTADHAADFHRDIFAVPGNIFSDLSYGPHMLIQKGAAMITCSQDILQELSFAVSEQGVIPDLVLNNLDEISKEIMQELKLGETSIDGLAESLGRDAIELNTKVTMLELQGLIKITRGVLRVA